MKEYIYEGKLNDKIKKLAVQIAEVVPSLDYVTEYDFCIWIAMENAPTDPKSGLRTTASIDPISHTHELYGYLLHVTGKLDKVPKDMSMMEEIGLPPYIITVYPQFFHFPVFSDDPKKESRVKVLIHELHHMAKNKKGTIQHTGFGDEQITEMYSQSIKKLRRLVGD